MKDDEEGKRKSENKQRVIAIREREGEGVRNKTYIRTNIHAQREIVERKNRFNYHFLFNYYPNHLQHYSSF